MPEGRMSVKISEKIHCSGYEDVGTIVIDYDIFQGKRNGKNFPSTQRRAYLPNNKEGNEVLELLKISFDRKLTFTVGTSVTTGMNNVIVWNSIHHKTNLTGGI